MAEQGNSANSYKCVPVCGAGRGSRFFRRVSAAFSAAVFVSGAGAVFGVSFCAFSSASFPGGFGNAFPARAVVRRILPFTNLYPSGMHPFTVNVRPTVGRQGNLLGNRLLPSALFLALARGAFRTRRWRRRRLQRDRDSREGQEKREFVSLILFLSCDKPPVGHFVSWLFDSGAGRNRTRNCRIRFYECVPPTQKVYFTNDGKNNGEGEVLRGTNSH